MAKPKISIDYSSRGPQASRTDTRMPLHGTPLAKFTSANIRGGSRRQLRPPRVRHQAEAKHSAAYSRWLNSAAKRRWRRRDQSSTPWMLSFRSLTTSPL
jgi:hypothetical protein